MVHVEEKGKEQGLNSKVIKLRIFNPRPAIGDPFFCGHTAAPPLRLGAPPRTRTRSLSGTGGTPGCLCCRTRRCTGGPHTPSDPCSGGGRREPEGGSKKVSVRGKLDTDVWTSF